MVSDKDIQSIVESVVKDVLNQHACDCPEKSVGKYMFDDMNECVEAAYQASRTYGALGIEKRRQIVEAFRKAAKDNAELLAHAAYEETKYGSIQDKILKCRLAADKTPGVEDIETKAISGDDGLTLIVQAPFGVIGSVCPSTNPVATVINNGISMTAAGNTVVFAPHPSAKKCTQLAIDVLNKAVAEAGCPVPLLYCAKEPSIETSNIMMNHKRIRLLAVTGGEAIVSIAMKTGKKVIGAGPGNPPVIVDETAIIPQAAKDIVDGACFENNIPCISEKETFAVESIAVQLVKEMVKAGAQLIDPDQADVLLRTVLTYKDGKYVVNRDCVGRDAAYLLHKAGLPVNGQPRLIVTICKKQHPFVTTEMLMPVMPVVFVPDVDTAIEWAVEAENGCHHSAHMHSMNVENLSKAARALDTTIFVKNAPSYAGIGFGGEGFTTFTIATPTGEGLTSARNFTRTRRCVLRDAFMLI